MPAIKQKPFSQLLKAFQKSMEEREPLQPRLVLIIMANTHDPHLNKACEKDAGAIHKVFTDICDHIHFDLCAIEIAGSHYNRKNLKKAVDKIILHSEDDVVLYYYSGHGFSYEKGNKTKYPQVDMRPHNDQKKYNKIDFIEKNTENLSTILTIMRFKGARINIAIGDCCNTTIPFKRPADSVKDMNIVRGVMPHKSKSLNKKIFDDGKNAVCILVSASQHGEPAVTDGAIGSIFTHHFTRTLADNVSKKPKGSQYLPWLKLLKQTSNKAFKDSQSYDVGNGKAGKQKAVFEVFIDREE